MMAGDFSPTWFSLSSAGEHMVGNGQSEPISSTQKTQLISHLLIFSNFQPEGHDLHHLFGTNV